MEDYFSIGELSRYQNISKQTLIFYDKLGCSSLPMWTPATATAITPPASWTSWTPSSF